MSSPPDWEIKENELKGEHIISLFD